MNLSGLFQYGNKSNAERNSGTVKVQTGTTASGGQGTNASSAIVPGQTVHGEVIGLNGNEVKLKLDKDIILTARLERDLNLAIGQSLTFEVRAGADAQIALRPLFENLALEANVLKALEAAKLPAAKELMQMVSVMMREGMPIGKASIQEMGRLVMSNPGVSPETLVMMRAMQLDITPENIKQFEQYRSYEHRILNHVTDILDELPKTFLTMTGNGQTNEAVKLYMQILQMFSGNQSVSAEGSVPHLLSAPETAQNNLFNIENALPGQEPGGTVFAAPEGKQQGISAGIQEGLQTGEQAAALLNKGVVLQNTDTLMAMLSGQDRTAGPENGTIQNLLGQTERADLVQLLAKSGFQDIQFLMQIKEGSIPADRILHELQTLLTDENNTMSKEAVIRLFASKEYNKLVNHEMLRQWLLKPEDVAKKDTVEEFYGRMREQTEKLTQTLGQALKDTPLARNLTIMQNNIDFMNQINQQFQYVQLPLKMDGGNAHGDLYVYANRKNAVKEDGSVSALLHLDMEHIGTVNIHVTMKDTNVSTKFYLRDEAMIDFVASHIHVLNDHLMKRGYSLNSEMLINGEENKDVIQTMLQREGKEEKTGSYSFDVRA